MSQEQKDHVEQSVQAEESDVTAAPLSSTPSPDSAPVEQEPVAAEGTTTTEGATRRGATGKKRTRARGRLVNAEEVMPRPSIWPLGMAFSTAFVLFGVIAGPIFLGIGVVLLLVCCLGWILERR